MEKHARPEIFRNNKKQILDIFELHKKTDKDPKSLIFASGRKLRKELNKIIKNLSKKHDYIQIINSIASKNKIGIQINNLDLNLGDKIYKNIKAKGCSKNEVIKAIKISGEDFKKLLKNKYIPSCKKINRIIKHLGLLKGIILKCRKEDYCLKKIILIYRSIYSRKKEIPLFVIGDLLNIWRSTLKIQKNDFIKNKNKIIKCVKYLRCNQFHSEKTKCCRYLNKKLAKIMGAFCADGSLSKDYMIRWEEEHLSNSLALINWLKQCFRSVEVKPEKRGSNSYIIKFRSKIMSRYMTNFFKIKPGIKVYTVHMPKIIKNSNANIRKAFAIGVMTFEGTASSFGSIALGVCSKRFSEDLVEIMKENDLEINQYESKKKQAKSTMYIFDSSNNIDYYQRKKFKGFFEPNTFKWLKMKEFEKGFSLKVNNKQEAIENLQLFFYKNNKINIPYIIDKCKFLKTFNIYNLMRETSYPRGTLSKYMIFLCKANILTKIRRKKSEYNFNNQVTEWRLPSTKFHQTLKTKL